MRIFVLLFLVITVTAQAGLLHEPGETVLPLLKMPLSVRVQAMGGAGAASTDDGAYASLNPAGIQRLKNDAVLLEHLNSLQETQRVEFINATLLYKRFRLGATLQFNDYGTAPLTTDGSDYSEANTFNTYDAVGMVTTGMEWRGVQWGATLKLFRQALFNESMSGGALDVGALYSTPVTGLDAGASLLNLGIAETVGGTRYPLTAVLRAGAAYTRIINDRLILMAALDVNATNDGALSLPAGLEARWNGLSMRGGYHFLHDTRTFSFGAGFTFARWTLDYAYLHSREDMDAQGQPHFFALAMAL